MNVSTLKKLRFDQYPLLLEDSFSQLNRASQFKFLSMWTLHEKYDVFTLESTKQGITSPTKCSYWRIFLQNLLAYHQKGYIKCNSSII